MAMKNLAENPYERLANAIIMQAVTEYRRELQKLKKNPKNSNTMYEVGQLECFFRSKWFHTITTLDGRVLIQRIRGELSEKPKAVRRRKK